MLTDLCFSAAADNTPEFEWSSVDDPSGVTYELQYSNGPDLPDEWLHGWEFRRAVTVNLAGDQEEGIVTDGLVGRWRLDGDANDSAGSNHGARVNY
ncbi:MAG: hypothetical protein AB1476_06120 [Candidatus Hadarchaeota archaeon]